MAAHPDLEDVFHEARSLVAILTGEVGPHEKGWILPGRDNSAPLTELYRTIRLHAPEAGPAFWSTSLWNHLNWQPVVIALISVHRFALLPDISSLAQKVGSSGVAGVRLASADVQRSKPEQLIGIAGAQLRSYYEAILAEQKGLQRHSGQTEFASVKPLTARRLLADRLLSLLVRLAPVLNVPDNEMLRAAASSWMAATGLESMSALLPIDLSNGREKLVLDRKACCMTFLRSGHEVCPSCPTQQSRQDRLRRLVAYWDKHES